MALARVTITAVLLRATSAFIVPNKIRHRCCYISNHPIHATPPNSSLDSQNSTDPVSWLTTRLGLDQELAASIVADHLPVLNYDIKTNLEPTVLFFENTLMIDGDDDDDDDDDAASRNRVAKILSESPGLLEYNVRKRLLPRLARVKAQGVVEMVDEEILRLICTNTDSMFEEWLSQKSDNRGDDDKQPLNDDDDFVVVERTPSSYIVLSNLQSGGNIGKIVRSASIFGCEECIVVGQKRYRMDGDHGSRFDLPRRHVWSHLDARQYLHERGVRIYGIEIMEDAAPIMRYDPETGVVRFPFDRQWNGAAFVMGNEGKGLSERQREICDEFLFIPQTRGGASEGGGSASLNVACAAAVILQAYCTWAGYPEARRGGEKFLAQTGESQRLRY
eukprot:CAMPEP_0195509778 /NCGR_PEP_ID=MMETSP0794_2-20130614/2621_1 /TAXON_ID=515487 /ORGANISM="Stephanopyxis turris, Strain CCMP 815" /LENGTH=389 /DNA_ID=CAMNT_0040637077 /DNA_START=1 /DNA_END=1167 /DNA_ORIENTATION=+